MITTGVHRYQSDRSSICCRCSRSYARFSMVSKVVCSTDSVPRSCRRRIGLTTPQLVLNRIRFDLATPVTRLRRNRSLISRLGTSACQVQVDGIGSFWMSSNAIASHVAVGAILKSGKFLLKRHSISLSLELSEPHDPINPCDSNVNETVSFHLTNSTVSNYTNVLYS
jgi:hypothetical protein